VDDNITKYNVKAQAQRINIADSVTRQWRLSRQGGSVDEDHAGAARKRMEPSSWSWWGWSNNSVILKDLLKGILCTNYVELVLKSSIEKRVGRTLSRVGKSTLMEAS